MEFRRRGSSLSPPTNPREVLQLLSQYDEADGIEGLLDLVDWSNSSPEQLGRAFGDPPELMPLVAASTGDGRKLGRSIFLSLQFQSQAIPFAIKAFPEKAKLLFVHVPKCGGTTVYRLLGKKYPWLSEHAVSPEWTPPAKFLAALGNFSRRAESSEAILITGHYSLETYLAKNIHRKGDKLFAVVRHPYDIAISFVNYMLMRFHDDPDCAYPDTSAWAKHLGMKFFDPSASPEKLKHLAFRLLREQSVNKTGVLTEYLGAGSASSAIRLMETVGIEIVHLDRLNDWLKARWNIESEAVENQSTCYLRRRDLDQEHMQWLKNACSEDMILYEYITKKMALTDSASIVCGPPISTSAANDGGALAAADMSNPEDIVASLYRAMLGREPDAGGLAHYVSVARNGCPLEVMIRQFLNSAEFASRVDRAPPPW